MSDKDPLGLFPPQQQPSPAPVVASSSDSGGFGWVLVGFLLGVALLMGYQRFGDGDFSHGGGDGRDKDEQTQPVDSAGYLIFVHERQTMAADEADMLDVAKDYAASVTGLEVRSLDDDDDSEPVAKIKEFAKSKGISPPFVVYKTKSNELRSAAKFPKSLSELKAVIK